jgi:hypothetical protein
MQLAFQLKNTPTAESQTSAISAAIISATPILPMRTQLHNTIGNLSDAAINIPHLLDPSMIVPGAEIGLLLLSSELY